MTEFDFQYELERTVVVVNDLNYLYNNINYDEISNMVKSIKNKIIFDVSNLKYFSSCDMGFFLRLLRDAKKTDHAFDVLCNETNYEMFKKFSLDKYFDIKLFITGVSHED